MKVIIFSLICLVFFAVNNADAALDKPYKCTDHYSTSYCIKTGQMAPKTTVQPTTPREIIDDFQKQISDLQKDLIKWKAELEEIDRNLQTLERDVKLVKDEVEKAKLSHKVMPGETTRLALEKAETNYTKAIKALADKNTLKSETWKKIDDANRKITLLKKQLDDSEKNLDKIKKTPTGIQTITISLSNTCITMIKNNLTTNCPTYETLLSLNWDTSKKESGTFEYKNGYYHRGAAKIKNDYKLYNLNDYNIIVDPSPSLLQNSKTITISKSLSSYFLPGDMVKKDDQVRIIHKDRYVESCKHAIISSDTWQQTLSDTIQYLRGGCTATLLNTVDAKTDDKTEIDISTSAKYKHDQWINNTKETHKELMINRDNSTNKSVIEDEG